MQLFLFLSFFFFIFHYSSIFLKILVLGFRMFNKGIRNSTSSLWLCLNDYGEKKISFKWLLN